MSKNITIAEGSQAKNFSYVSKIRTNKMGGGTQDWIPEDEAGMYANLGVAEITENGTYRASDENLDGFSEVAVSVQPKTKTKTITKNGTYRASKDKVDGYSEISVQVPTEGGGGGSTLITKDITENGSYNASDDDADGYSSVNVNVAGINIQGTEMQATAINAISKGATVYVHKSATNPTSVTPPTGLQDGAVYLWNGEIYFNNGRSKVPYSNLTATPTAGGFNGNASGNGGYVVGDAGNYQSRIISIASGQSLIKQGVGRNAVFRTANQKVSFGNGIYDQSLNLLATLNSSAYGFPRPDNVLVGLDSNSNGGIVKVCTGVITSVPVTGVAKLPSSFSDANAQLLDYRLFSYTSDANGNSTGDFGYIDTQGIEATGVATFVKLFDCYAGSEPHRNIFVSISNDHTQIVVRDTTHGIYIVKSDGSYVNYSDLPHAIDSSAYLVGSYLFDAGSVYDVSSEASMGMTSSRNHEYLGICKNDVAAGAVGTAIVLFS